MISVIIPVYNGEKTLRDAIDSVVAQTDDEVIVVNDGSTDSSSEIAHSYEDVTVIDQVNKGLASARNTAIMRAKGDYILPLDADDMLGENCLKKIYDRIDETHADIIAPSFRTFGKTEREVILMASPTLKDFTTANRIGYFSAIKKEALLECGGYSPRMTWGYEDYHLWFDLLSRGKTISVIQEPLMWYRTSDTSMMSTSILHHDELMAQIKKDFPHAWL